MRIKGELTDKDVAAAVEAYIHDRFKPHPGTKVKVTHRYSGIYDFEIADRFEEEEEPIIKTPPEAHPSPPAREHDVD